MFRTDQKRLYQELDGKSWDNTILPDAEESCAYRCNIWDNPVRHNEEAEWLNEVKADLRDYEVQSNVLITLKEVKDLAEKAC